MAHPARDRDETVRLDGAALPGIDPAGVNAWLASATPLATPVTFDLIAAGGSNLTYRLTDTDGRHWVLRRPPEGDLLRSAHDVAREHRILHGLADTPVAVPGTVALCTDVDVTGAPFFVMEYVDGLIVRSTAMGEALGTDRARAASVQFFEALAQIHATPPAAAGLGDLSRTDGYVERQLHRWHGQYLQTAGAEALTLEASLHERLGATVPADVDRGRAHLIHGDFHIDNAVFDDDMQVRAIFDWELATLGHPIADLAWALLFWSEPGDPATFLSDPPSLAPGFLTRDEVIGVYGRASGLPVDAMAYFSAFSRWKMGCLLSGTLHRARRGTGGGLRAAGHDDHEALLARIEALFEQAAGLL